MFTLTARILYLIDDISYINVNKCEDVIKKLLNFNATAFCDFFRNDMTRFLFFKIT